MGEAHVTDCGAAGLQGKVRAEDAVEIVKMLATRIFRKMKHVHGLCRYIDKVDCNINKRKT